MDKIIFSKYSNDRGVNFKIRTDICLDFKGNKYVKKHPLTEESKEHINHILKVHDKLQEKYGEIININECSINTAGDIMFPYICGQTLNEKMNLMCKNGDSEGIIKLINRYKDVVQHNADKKFEVTDDFVKVFGDVELSSEYLSTEVADIDLIFENILVTEDNWSIIDYEWTFLFPVPVNFIIYRAISAFVEGLYSQSDKKLVDLDLYEYCGITQQEIIEYKKMIECFEKYVMDGGDTMKTLHGKISQKIYKPDLANKIVYDNLEKMGVQVFPDFGNGYEEGKSYFIGAKADEYGYIQLNIDIEEMCCGYRIDPAMDCCILDIEKIEIDGVEWKDYSTNGFQYSDGILVFDTADSQLYIKNIHESKKMILLARVVLIEKNMAVAINNYAKSRISDYEKLNEEFARVNKIAEERELRFVQVNRIAEERNQQILDLNKLAEEQNTKVADLYKQLEDLYAEKNEMEQDYIERLEQMYKSHDILVERNKKLNEEIDEIKSSKVWRLYSKYKAVRDKS